MFISKHFAFKTVLFFFNIKIVLMEVKISKDHNFKEISFNVSKFLSKQMSKEILESNKIDISFDENSKNKGLVDENLLEKSLYVKSRYKKNDQLNEKNLNVSSNQAITNKTELNQPNLPGSSFSKYIFTFACFLYGIVCVVGLCGNTLVIYVVLRFSKMQTVTNMYILNLAFADEMFLVGLPILITTLTYKYWAFGWLMCKIYMIITSINQFTSSLLLTVMSADRYIAVCHPISSSRYRTPCIAKIICLSVWTLSAYLMIPIYIFADVQLNGNTLSCNIYWPEMSFMNGQRAFTLYSFTLGFFLPLMLILLFYFMVICKLRTLSTKHKSREKKKTQKKVTYLVLTVITVYVACWSPYWISQMYITFHPPQYRHTDYSIGLMLLASCLSYVNSAVNPILYAFLSENFKKSFAKAFTCAANIDVNAQLHGENSVFPQQQKLNKKKSKQAISTQTKSKSASTNQEQKFLVKNKKFKKPKDSLMNENVKNLANKEMEAKEGNQFLYKKHKRFSLDFTNSQQIHYFSDTNRSKKTDDKLFIQKDNIVTNSNKNNNLDPTLDLKRRRKSDSKIIIRNSQQFKNENLNKQNLSKKSILTSHDEITIDKTEYTDSSLEDDDIVYLDTEEKDDDDDTNYKDDVSSFNSQDASKTHDCAAMILPSKIKKKFSSMTSKSKLTIRKIDTNNSISSIKKSNNNNIELNKIQKKMSLEVLEDVEKNEIFENVSSSKKSNKFLNLFYNKFEKSSLKKKKKIVRPENRVSKKRISQAEANHHRFKDSKSNEIKTANNFIETIEITDIKKEDLKNDDNNNSNTVKLSNSSFCGINYHNSNLDVNLNEALINEHSCSLKLNNLIEISDCSECLEKKGVIQTEL